MANWYYYNESGEKIEVTGGQLKGLAKSGVITPDTMIETEDGKTAPARKVKGLTFGDSVQSESASSVSLPTESIPVEQSAPMAVPTPGSYCTHCGQPVNPTAAACMACGADPRVHRKFCGACGTPINEVQVICTKCHTPVVSNAGAVGVPTAQTPVTVTTPIQPTAQSQPGASAQLVIELPSKFNNFVPAGNYDVLIDGKKLGEIAHQKSIEISVPTGWIKLDVRSSKGRKIIDPVSIDSVAGKKMKVIIHSKKYYELRGKLLLLVSFILAVMVMPVLLDKFGAILGFVFMVIPIIVPIAVYVQIATPYVIENVIDI